jgi:GT2 family glycosyltransferase
MSKVCCNRRSGEDDVPSVSFLIGHRGKERLPNLLATLQSIAAQVEVSFECIVVEQDESPLLADALPGWVRYVHAPLAVSCLLYNRSQALNDAARLARGGVLILHDNDMLVPVDYAAQALRRCEQGYEVLQLKRFVFYLDESSTEQVCHSAALPVAADCEQVIENLCGGGSLAVSARAYQKIGGMDEAFIGWGGEDEEFWDRCRTRKVWAFGCLPIVHLWHPPQPGKRAAGGQGSYTAELTALRRAIPPEQRIAELTARREGASQ